MHATHHSKARQAQRGIPLKMIDYVLAHDTVDQDKFIISTKEAKQRLADLEREKRLLMNIQDKGGIVVVAKGDALITTYNCTQRA
ncbi:hypothetical protein [Pseudomonas alkylphenolica]|uniref:DUF4258 domain-containing protein n=1 Tax=Pseudomonas alkylphenolica TaxID=237609 RepID=A0A077F1B9_9PSED|nr:hypothetical protein [Pseudomonas alkylphenolica]AIL59257.1 hypothetical protein PSAKL28_00190 [Pseudomonas alkylphenolica]